MTTDKTAGQAAIDFEREIFRFTDLLMMAAIDGPKNSDRPSFIDYVTGLRNTVRRAVTNHPLPDVDSKRKIADLENALKEKGPLTFGIALSDETQKVVELQRQLQIALPEIVAFRTALRRLVNALSERERSPDLTDAYDAAVAVLDVKPDHYHPDNIAIDRFADAMKAKMAKKRAEGRGGWDDPAQCPVSDLAEMLVDHLPKGDPVDIGNFAMMLFNRDGGAQALVNLLNAPPPAPSNDKAEPQPMTQEEFDNLQPGDVVRHRYGQMDRTIIRAFADGGGYEASGKAKLTDWRQWLLVSKAAQPQPPVSGISDTL